MPGPSSPKPKKLLDQLREAIRTKHYSYSTEKTYVHYHHYTEPTTIFTPSTGITPLRFAKHMSRGKAEWIAQRIPACAPAKRPAGVGVDSERSE